jgi:hypothetical protein
VYSDFSELSFANIAMAHNKSKPGSGYGGDRGGGYGGGDRGGDYGGDRGGGYGDDRGVGYGAGVVSKGPQSSGQAMPRGGRASNVPFEKSHQPLSRPHPSAAAEDDDLARALAASLAESEVSVEQHRPQDVHSPVPVMDLFVEYERGRCAALYDAKLKALSVFYRAVRRIRGEGNCFYRSFWMGWIERMLENRQRGSSATSVPCHPLLANPESAQWEARIVEISDRAAQSFKAAGAKALEEELVISATPGFIEVTRGLCRGYADEGEPGLLKKARETDQTAKALRWLRLIASAYMRGKEEDFSIIAIGMGYDSLPAFCDAQVEADCSLADEPQIMALTGALGIAVRVEYLDDVAYPWSSRCGPHRHVIRPLEASEASGDSPPIAACVLFRPGHYDLLIPSKWSEPALLEPDGERLVLPQQPPRPPPTQPCSWCHDPRLAGCWLCGEGVCTKRNCRLEAYVLSPDLGGGVCCPRCFDRFPRYNPAAATNPPPPRSDTHTLWSCDGCEELNFPSRLREHQIGACRKPALPTRAAPASAGEDESGGSRAGVELVPVLTLYDANGDGVFDFNEFIELVSDLLCLRDGVLSAPPQAGRNLAEVLAKQIPGPTRDTIEVAHLVELDGRWASLITQPDVVAAGGAGLRSLSDQRLHGDLDDLRARRQAELVSGATRVAAETSGDGNGIHAVVAAVGAGSANSAPRAPVELVVTAFDPYHRKHGYEDNFFGLSCDDASKVVTPEGVAPCIVKFDEGRFAKVSFVTHEKEHEGSKTGQKYVYIEPNEADHDGRPLRSLNRDRALRAGAKLTFLVPNIAPASPLDATAAQWLHDDIKRLERAGYARRDCEQALRMCENNYERAARALQDSREYERLRMCEDNYERAARVLQDSRECERPQNLMSAAAQGVAEAAVGAAQGVVGAAQGMAAMVAGAARMGVAAVVGNQSNRSFEADGAAVGAEHLAQQEQASADAVHQLAAEEYDLQTRERLEAFLDLIRNDRHPDLQPNHAHLAIQAQRAMYAGKVAQTDAASLDRRFAAFGLALEAEFIPQEIKAIAAGAFPPHEYICKYCSRRFRTLQGQRWHEVEDPYGCLDWKTRGRMWAERYDKRNPQWAIFGDHRRL